MAAMNCARFWVTLRLCIPDILDEYVEIERMFISICSRKGSPTFEQVKDLCIDLIQARTEGGGGGGVRTNPPPVPVANKNQNITIL